MRFQLALSSIYTLYSGMNDLISSILCYHHCDFYKCSSYKNNTRALMGATKHNTFYNYCKRGKICWAKHSQF